MSADSPSDDLPPFESNGYLPPGDHAPTRAAFERRFVHVIGSTTRSAIYDGYNNHRAELLKCGISPQSNVLLDGGYTTSAIDPKDIDLVVEYEPHGLDPA